MSTINGSLGVVASFVRFFRCFYDLFSEYFVGFSKILFGILEGFVLKCWLQLIRVR